MKQSEASKSQGRTYREVGEYWDSHDLGEVWEDAPPVDIEVDISSQKRYYLLDKGLSERVRQIAKARGISAETLVNLWIQEKVSHTGS
jgi:CopG antitoxin of type II toxin-antitoxin system